MEPRPHDVPSAASHLALIGAGGEGVRRFRRSGFQVCELLLTAPRECDSTYGGDEGRHADMNIAPRFSAPLPR